MGVAGLAVAGGTVAGPLATPAPAAHGASAAKPAAVANAAPTQAKAPAKAPSAEELDYQYEAQSNFYYCGPASTRIALTATGHAPSQDDVARQLGTTVNGTNSAEDTTRVLNSLGGSQSYKTMSIPGASATPAEMDRLQADVVKAVHGGRAVVANVVGTATDTDGAVHSYEGGHYLTVVGYLDEGRTVKIADPANVNGQASYWMTTIDLANWMATRGYSA